jgi:proline iminopeptidase
MSDALFALLEPYAADWLDVGEGHRVRYEQCGRRDGVPALFLHGGPAAASVPTTAVFSIQSSTASCSRINAAADNRVLSARSPATPPIIWCETSSACASISVLRDGCCSAEAGAARSRSPTHKRIPIGSARSCCAVCFLGTDSEVEWFLTGLQRFLPEAWDALTAQIDDRTVSGLLRHFEQRAQAGDESAALRWTAWENAVMGVGEAPSSAAAGTPAAALARVRVQLHYLVHSCFLARDQLLYGLDAMQQLPAIIVQGRRDLVCPPLTAYTVAQRWRCAELRMIEDGGHSAMHASMASALVRATQDIKRHLLST